MTVGAARATVTAMAPMVRPATPGDAGGIVALLDAVAAEGWLGIAPGQRTAEQEHLALSAAPPEDFAVWVAEGSRSGQGLTGHLVLARGARPYCAHTATVAVAVARRVRGVGLGGALLDGALRWARQHGIDRVCAGVLADNAAALALFTGRGFLREGLHRHQILMGGVYRDEVSLARFVGGPDLEASGRDGGGVAG